MQCRVTRLKSKHVEECGQVCGLPLVAEGHRRTSKTDSISVSRVDSPPQISGKILEGHKGTGKGWDQNLGVPPAWGYGDPKAENEWSELPWGRMSLKP